VKIPETREIVTEARRHKGGLGALFTGSSGAGKTVAAAAIARQLGRQLHVVDLSGVVSKYIGETEKNLNRIFDQAAVSDAVLLLDEADALFGKRSEVKDSHDRYANQEVSYLLQRIEAYAGLVILATNQQTNIDPAFLRRLRFIVDFPVPAA
jgi:SpoVK/Ycf46/Vps4 family AAA+-type ATPase